MKRKRKKNCYRDITLMRTGLKDKMNTSSFQLRLLSAHGVTRGCFDVIFK